MEEGGEEGKEKFFFFLVARSIGTNRGESGVGRKGAWLINLEGFDIGGPNEGG